MVTIEKLEADLRGQDLIYIHNPLLGNLIDQLITLAKQYRDNARHDRNAIRELRRQTFTLTILPKGSPDKRRAL